MPFLYATLRQRFCFVLSPKKFKHKIGVYRGVSHCIKSLNLMKVVIGRPAGQSRDQLKPSLIEPASSGR